MAVASQLASSPTRSTLTSVLLMLSRKKCAPSQLLSKVLRFVVLLKLKKNVGSGWGWLGWNKTASKLQVATCQNQDPLEATTGLIPLLGIDVWEHAYYIQYKNLRAQYVEKIFDVFNWNNVAERFAKAKK